MDSSDHSESTVLPGDIAGTWKYAGVFDGMGGVPLILRMEAACGCHTGYLRKNNEDNFYFSGKYLDAEHGTLQQPLYCKKWFVNGWTAAVFDGMGGENFGERASFAAARALASVDLRRERSLKGLPKCLLHTVEGLNQAVVDVQKEMMTTRMGSTMAAVSFFTDTAYLYNLGDSKAYCMRDGDLIQLSRDHVASVPSRTGRKQPLTQYLGINPDEMVLEPTIVAQPYKRGDIYLLCSDGLSDMLTDREIADILKNCQHPEVCVNRLIEASLVNGGRDNITVIVCSIG